MKTVGLLIISCIAAFQTIMADHHEIKSQCDSLIFYSTSDVYLQQDCEVYFQEQLKQIPQKEIKDKKAIKKELKSFPDSIKQEILDTVNSYKWEDKGVTIQFLADYLFQAPSFKKTIWDDSTITTVYVKGNKGCKKVTLAKDSSYSGFINSSNDTINDTIHVTKDYFAFREALYITKSISTVLTIKGDTISFFSIDKHDEVGTITGITNEYIEFSGKTVSLRAVCNQNDTLEVECQNYTREKCILCGGISIITGTLDTDFGTTGGTRSSIFSIYCDENPCRTTQAPIAIYLINSSLKDKPFSTMSPDKGPRIYSSCEECEKDKESYLFPGVD
jgi:hypothetical protein